MTLVHINAEGQRLVSQITDESVQELGLKPGDPVIALVNSTDARLLKGDATKLKRNARDCLVGQVASFQKGNATGYVTLKVGDLQVVASKPREALDDMHINNGDRITAIIKATEVILQKA